MKKMATQDFEDLLQVKFYICTIPVFDTLLPELHNTNVLTLLYTCAHWHALTKLCMHTNETLDLLNTATVMLGNQLHNFQKHTYTFNLKMYKLHALGDYSTSIHNFGTTDSYSTEPGELEHHTLKAMYH
ncbi:hypothetical protein BDR04DRAFT_1128942 [Suillus decipiens]|nr:hypothetical protein BDR04DRAFT_1128942 [Suillus decipiens]